MSAIINYDIEHLDGNRLQVTWQGLALSDSGQAFEVPWAPATTTWQVQMTPNGTIGVEIQGSNLDVNESWKVLATLSNPEFIQVDAACRFFRPHNLTSANSIDAILFVVRQDT
jgi:hypothetical protein